MGWQNVDALSSSVKIIKKGHNETNKAEEVIHIT